MVNKNEVIIEKLTTIYNRALRLEDLKNFLLSIYEYIDLFDTIQELEPVCNSIKELEEKDHESLKVLETKALKELETAYLSIKEYINAEKMDNATVLDELRDYEYSLGSKYWSSSGVLRDRFSSLTYVLMTLVELDAGKHFVFCRKYGTIQDNGRILNWGFSPSYDAWESLDETLKKTELITVWYSWAKLVNFYGIYKGYAGLQDINIKEHRIWNTYGLSMLNDEITSIMEGREFKARMTREYKLDDYKIHLERVHYYTKEYLINNNNISVEPLRWNYDTYTGVLTIKDTNVFFKQEGFPAKLLYVLTNSNSSRKKKWDCGEIYERIEAIDIATKIQSRKVYDTGKNINKRLAEESHISDFLLVTTSTIQINPKYL